MLNNAARTKRVLCVLCVLLYVFAFCMVQALYKKEERVCTFECTNVFDIGKISETVERYRTSSVTEIAMISSQLSCFRSLYQFCKFQSASKFTFSSSEIFSPILAFE